MSEKLCWTTLESGDLKAIHVGVSYVIKYVYASYRLYIDGELQMCDDELDVLKNRAQQYAGTIAEGGPKMKEQKLLFRLATERDIGKSVGVTNLPFANIKDSYLEDFKMHRHLILKAIVDNQFIIKNTTINVLSIWTTALVELEWPTCGDTYWYADSVGNIGNTIWNKDYIDEFRESVGNVHKTEEDAEHYKKRLIEVAKTNVFK